MTNVKFKRLLLFLSYCSNIIHKGFVTDNNYYITYLSRLNFNRRMNNLKAWKALIEVERHKVNLNEQ